MNRIKIFIIFIFLFSSALQASQWSREFVVTYPMGAGESLVTARQIATEQIKRKAIDAAGTYIQTTINLENDTLTEQIKTVSSAIVHISSSQETLTVSESNRMTLELSAQVSVDENVLKERIKALQNDQQKAKQIAQLSKENSELRKQLDKVVKELSSNNLPPEKVSTLLYQQTEMLKKLEKTNSDAALVFKRGTLLQMASRYSAEMEAIKNDLERNVITPVLNTDIETKIDNVIELEDGSYEVLVRVGWDLDHETYKAHLGKYISANYRKSYRGSNEYIQATLRNNRNSKGTSPLSEQALMHLIDQRVNAVIEIGPQKKKMGVLYAASDMFGGTSCKSPVQRDQQGKFRYQVKAFCVSSQRLENENLAGYRHGHGKNPLRFKLSKQEAENLTSIKAYMERR